MDSVEPETKLRQVVAARAYVEGLERDRELLHRLQKASNEDVWALVNYGSLNRALVRVLGRIISNYEHGVYEPDLFDYAEKLMEDSQKLQKEAFCPCGHAMWDHDENGCVYLGCKNICGAPERST